MLPDPLWRLAHSALTWFVGYLKNTSRLYVLKRLDSLTIKNWKWKIYKVIFNFWFIWTFAASACSRHRKIRTQKKNFWHCGYSGRQKKYWTNVKTPRNMDRVMGTWFELLNNRNMIENTELEFEHRTDISCNKLEWILLPPYIFIERQGGK